MKMKNTNKLWACILLALIVGCGKSEKPSLEHLQERLLYLGGWQIEDRSWLFKIVAVGFEMRGQVFVVDKQDCRSAPAVISVLEDDNRQSLVQWREAEFAPCADGVPDLSLTVPLDSKIVKKALGLRIEKDFLTSHEDGAFVNLFSGPGPLTPLALGSDSAELVGNHRTWIEPVFSVSMGQFKGLALPSDLARREINVKTDDLALPITVWRVLINEQDRHLLYQNRVARCLDILFDWKIEDLVSAKIRKGFRQPDEEHRDQIRILESVLNQDFSGFAKDEEYSRCLK